MGSEESNVKMLFFPFMAQGHLLPMVDMAKLFAGRGVRATLLTTPANARLVQPSIDRANVSGHQHPIQLSLIPFPSGEVGLPKECENISSLPSLEAKNNFFAACSMLREPFARVLTSLAPDCVVTDMFFPWTCNVAAELSIPRLVFHGISLFALSATHSVNRHKPLENLPADAETFVIPGIPHRIEMFRSQMARFDESDSALMEIVNQMTETDPKNYGTVVNSFCELEPDYAQYYKSNSVGRTWHVGPLSLCNNDTIDKSARGAKTANDANACLDWLDIKTPGSVVYVCFGSMSEFSDDQLQEIALGLEGSNHSFIWVVRKGGDGWIPKGYGERIKEKGLIMRGWAPQILILNHSSVGGFLTHCGWNSCLEGISAGLPLATWPLFAEQFYNERMIVDVLKIGVAVGVKEFGGKAVVEAAEIARAVDRVMDDSEEAEAEARRERARELGKAAKKAVEKGGSSYDDMGKLIQELKDMHAERR